MGCETRKLCDSPPQRWAYGVRSAMVERFLTENKHAKDTPGGEREVAEPRKSGPSPWSGV